MSRLVYQSLLSLVFALFVLGIIGCGDDDSSAFPPVSASTTPAPPANGDDSLSYNFSGIEGSEGVIQGDVSHIHALLDQGSACVKKLASVWGGSGSDSYQVTQRRWDTTAAELNAALADLAAKLSEASQGMQSTEQNVNGMFSFSFGSTPMLNINFQGMEADAAALSAAATEFDGISSELKSAISSVDETAGGLAVHLQGPAGTAAQAAFQRFREAAQKQENELNNISASINAAGVQYQSAAEDASSSLETSMGF